MAYASYPTYPSYLDFVSLAPSPPGSTQLVRTPRITDQGVMQSEPEVGAGASAGPPSPEGTALTTGDAVTMSTPHPTGMGFNAPGMLPGMFQGSNNVNQGARALAILGLMDPAMVAGMPLAGTLFSTINALAGFGTGFNINPTTGLPVNSTDFQGLKSDPMFASFIDFNSPAISPLSEATIGPISANQPGFSISPFATGTPFSANPVGRTGETNFTSLTPRGETGPVGPPPAATDPTDPGPPNAPTGPDSPDGDEARGGWIRRTRRGQGDVEPRWLTAGEFVIRRSAATKHRALLEAINRGAHPNVLAHLARRVGGGKGTGGKGGAAGGGPGSSFQRGGLVRGGARTPLQLAEEIIQRGGNADAIFRARGLDPVAARAALQTPGSAKHAQLFAAFGEEQPISPEVPNPAGFQRLFYGGGPAAFLYRAEQPRDSMNDREIVDSPADAAFIRLHGHRAITIQPGVQIETMRPPDVWEYLEHQRVGQEEQYAPPPLSPSLGQLIEAQSGGTGYARGGPVPGSLRETRDDKFSRLQSGEFVVRRSSAAKYRTLLEAINGDRPAEVKRLAAKLRARFAA